MQKKSGNMARVLEEFPSINEKENMPFFKIFYNFAYFCPNLFCPFCPFSGKSSTCPYFLEYPLTGMVNQGKNVIPILFWLLPWQRSGSDDITMESKMQQCKHFSSYVFRAYSRKLVKAQILAKKGTKNFTTPTQYLLKVFSIKIKLCIVFIKEDSV